MAVVTKSIEALQQNRRDLEEILAQREQTYAELCEKVDAAVAAESEVERAQLSEFDTLLEEVQQLSRRNAFLRRALKKMHAEEKQHERDPRVLDKRNEVRAVQKEVRQIEREIATLQVMKKRRDEGLREIDETNAEARRVRGKQQERNTELRATLKTLMEQLRKEERKDVEAHEHFTRLQDIVKLAVTEDEVSRLERAVQRQQKEITELEVRAQAAKAHKERGREVEYQQVFREKKLCERLERQLEQMHSLLNELEHE